MNFISTIKLLEIWSNELKRDLSSNSSKLEEVLLQQYHSDKWSLLSFNFDALQNLCNILTTSFFADLHQKYDLFLKNKKKREEVVVLLLDQNDIEANIMHIIAIILCGYQCKLHTKHQNQPLLSFLLNQWTKIDADITHKIIFSDTYPPFDTIIYSDKKLEFNYPERYFSQYKTFKTSNKKSSVILTGNEANQELTQLFQLQFRYFGKSVGNITKLLVPKDYDFSPLILIFNELGEEIASHHLYLNHLSYQKTVHLVNKISFIDGGIILFVGNENGNPPSGVVHYQRYASLDELLKKEFIDNSPNYLFAPSDFPIPHYSLLNKNQLIVDDFEQLFNFLIEQN